MRALELDLPPGFQPHFAATAQGRKRRALPPSPRQAESKTRMRQETRSMPPTSRSRPFLCPDRPRGRRLAVRRPHQGRGSGAGQPMHFNRNELPSHASLLHNCTCQPTRGPVTNGRRPLRACPCAACPPAVWPGCHAVRSQHAMGMTWHARMRRWSLQAPAGVHGVRTPAPVRSGLVPRRLTAAACSAGLGLALQAAVVNGILKRGHRCKHPQ